MEEDKYEFACDCDEKGAKEIEEVREWALDYLQTIPSRLISAILYRLALDYNASITGTYADQWGLITATSPRFSTDVMCDNFEDGFLYVFKKFYDNGADMIGSNMDDV